MLSIFYIFTKPNFFLSKKNSCDKRFSENLFFWNVRTKFDTITFVQDHVTSSFLLSLICVKFNTQQLNWTYQIDRNKFNCQLLSMTTWVRWGWKSTLSQRSVASSTTTLSLKLIRGRGRHYKTDILHNSTNYILYRLRIFQSPRQFQAIKCGNAIECEITKRLWMYLRITTHA